MPALAPVCQDTTTVEAPLALFAILLASPVQVEHLTTASLVSRQPYPFGISLPASATASLVMYTPALLSAADATTLAKAAKLVLPTVTLATQLI